MQHQFWITKQTLSRKLGRKEDECIVSSDAQLDAKLELFRNIQMSCSLIQRIIDKYQESICCLSQELNSMGRFLKENTEDDKSRTGEIMLTIGKSLIFCAQQQLVIHEPLIRFYQELETFRQRAVGDTLQNILAMEKSRTEYRAALSWMKNISQQLNPDTTKQLEKFKKVQNQVRRGKINFDKQSLDCLQKIDLLAAARCNMFNYALSFYQNKLMNYIEKTARTYTTVSEKFDRQSQASNKIDITRSTKDKINPKENKSINDESDHIKNEARLIDDIPLNASLFDAFHSEGLSNSQRNSSDIDNTLLNICNWQIPNRSSQSEQSGLVNEQIVKDINSLCQLTNIEELKSEDNITNVFNIEEENNFLPSALLKESLENALSGSKSQEKNIFQNKNNTDLLKNNDSTKSWMNLFEELDPLSNNLNDKLIKYKGPFV